MIVGRDPDHLGHLPRECEFCVPLGTFSSRNRTELYADIGATVAGEVEPFEQEDVVLYMVDPNTGAVIFYDHANNINMRKSPSGLVGAYRKAVRRGIIVPRPTDDIEVEGPQAKLGDALERLTV